MKIYSVIAGLLMAFSSLAADVNITNVTRAATVPSGSYALGTTGLVTRLLPINLMSVSHADTATTSTNIVSGGSLTVDSFYAANAYATNMLLIPATVATLPAAPTFPQIAYASDVVTSSGIGGYVRWDVGSSLWRTFDGVRATSDLGTYAWYGFGSGLNSQTPIVSALFNSENNRYMNEIMWTQAGTASAYTPGGISSSGSTVQLAAGTTSTGTSYKTVIGVAAMAANTVMANYSTVYVSAACNGTDSYYCLVGMGSTTDSSFPTSGAYFIYDMYTNKISSTNAIMTTAATNNWLCVVAKPPAYAVIDSGLTPSTSSSAMDRLGVVYTNGAVTFYTNGVVCATVTTNLPTGTLYLGKTYITKTGGGTSVSIFEGAWGVHSRHAARTYP